MSGMNKWSSKFDSCVRCLGTDYKYMGRGLCSRCYLTEYNAANQEKIKQHKHNWYAIHGGPAMSKLKREERYFDSKREQVLERDGYKCTKCGSPDKLVVHHLDGNGRGHPNPNNDLSNLTTRCRGCHANDHRKELWAARRLKIVHMWAKRYNLTACKQCGSSERRHNAFGMCWKCYRKLKSIIIAYEKDTKVEAKA